VFRQIAELLLALLQTCDRLLKLGFLVRDGLLQRGHPLLDLSIQLRLRGGEVLIQAPDLLSQVRVPFAELDARQLQVGAELLVALEQLALLGDQLLGLGQSRPARLEFAGRPGQFGPQPAGLPLLRRPGRTGSAAVRRPVLCGKKHAGRAREKDQ